MAGRRLAAVGVAVVRAAGVVGALVIALGGQARATQERLLVAAWPNDVLTDWPAHAGTLGQTGPALSPACAAAAPGLQRCLMVEEAGRRRLATGVDVQRLGGWPAVEARLAAVARPAVEGLAERPVPDMPGRTFFVRSQRDGLDTALVAAPRAVHARFGPATVMAFPDAHTTLVWRRGDPELDKVLAVAVWRAWEAAERPVSPRVYRWDGEGLVEWAAARPSGPPAP